MIAILACVIEEKEKQECAIYTVGYGRNSSLSVLDAYRMQMVNPFSPAPWEVGTGKDNEEPQVR